MLASVMYVEQSDPLDCRLRCSRTFPAHSCDTHPIRATLIRLLLSESKLYCTVKASLQRIKKYRDGQLWAFHILVLWRPQLEYYQNVRALFYSSHQLSRT